MKTMILQGAKFLCAGLALALGLGAPGAAQIGGRSTTLLELYDVGPSATCPTEETELIRSRNVRAPRLFLRQGFGFSFFSGMGLEHSWQNAFAAATPLPRLPQPYQRVILLGESSDLVDGERRWLIAWDNGDEARSCTWVPASAVLKGDEVNSVSALLNGPKVLEVRDLERLRDPESRSSNTLALKVVLSNLNVAGDEGVPVFLSPDARDPIGRLDLFELFAVFDVDLGAARRNNNPVHFLIGKDEIGNRRLEGWVHQEDVFEWASRMAVFGAQPNLQVFFREQDGRFSVDDSLSQIPYSEITGRSRQRFPVLATVPDAPEVKQRVDQLYAEAGVADALALSRQVDGYQVILPTANCNAAGADCISPEEFERRRIEYQRRVDELKNVDILLLADATESMSTYFKPMARALEAFAETTLASSGADEGTQVRVSVFVYGDYQDGIADPFQVFFTNLVPWHRPGEDRAALDNMARFVDAYASVAPKDPERDKYEGSLAAILRAAQDGGWRDDAGFRMVVHLGDHGSRPFGEASGENGSDLEETVSVDHAVAALREAGVLYVPVSVVGRAGVQTPFAQDARQAFKDQGQYIQEASGISSQVVQTYEDVTEQELPERITASVFTVLEDVWDFNVKSQDLVRLRELCARNPGHPNCEILDKPEQVDGVGARVSQFLDDSKGLTPEQIANIYSRRDNIAKVWLQPITRNARGEEVDALSYWVAIDNKRFENMIQGFDDLCAQIEPVEDGRDISGRILQGFAPIISEFANEANQEFYRRAPLAQTLSLPFVERSEYLSFSPQALEAAIRSNDDELLWEMQGAFCRTSFLFEQISAGNRLYVEEGGVQRAPAAEELERSDRGYYIGRGRANVERDYEWLIKVDRGEGVVYVPFDYFP